MALAHRLFQDFAQGVANAKCHNLRRGGGGGGGQVRSITTYTL